MSSPISPTDLSPAPVHPDRSRTDDSAWWRDAVLYQVYPRSFADSNGDGIGDIPGIASRLPYLRDLGVDALWLTPFYPSSQADGGYDVADYRGVDPLFGTLDEADELIREAHGHGLRVVVDLVPNHTSSEHVWFQQAVAAGPGSPERERYLFREGRGLGDEPPNDWISVFGGPAWTRLPDGEWYLRLYNEKQPDLNWQHPEVREEFLSVLRFWLDRGVDGFRIDVAHGLIKDLSFPDLGERRFAGLERSLRIDHPFWDQDGVHEIYRSWRVVLDEYGPDRMLVAEARVATPERLARYIRPDELHTAFNFDFLEAPWDAAHLRAVIDSSLAANDAVGAPTTWVLSNHDVHRPPTRHSAGDPALGLRRARALALLSLALPGGAYIYQGDELGLPEVLDLPDEALQDPRWEQSGHSDRGRDGCRVPLPWTREGSSYGFGPAGAWLPQPAYWGELSAESQDGVAGSTLELYCAALRLRRHEPALGGGGLAWVETAENTLAFRRTAASSDNTRDRHSGAVVCVVNLASTSIPLPTGDVILASGDAIPTAELPPDEAIWLRC